MSKINAFPTLLTAAEAYYYLGYAVIPLLGDFDPSRPKVAARAWSVYQRRLAELNEFSEWFSPEGGAAALGIVTGRISRLVVLDFDSADLFADFRLRFPDLTETRTVQSAGRGLPHLYFHLPAHLNLASQKKAGVDLLSDGRYVVAPPSVINQQPYRITRGGMPRTLTERDIHHIQSFMKASQSSSSLYTVGNGLRPFPSTTLQTPPAPESNSPSVGTQHAVSAVYEEKTETPLSTQWRGVGDEEKIPTPSPTLHQLRSQAPPLIARKQGGKLPSPAALHGLYLYWCKNGGRNDALFRTAIYARDHGLNETQTRHALVSLYVSTPLSSAKPPGGMQWRRAGGEEKQTESPAQRQREAYATIRSAFSRPPRPQAQASSPAREAASEGGLPNSIREALLSQKQACVLRTIEALFKRGFRAGRYFTTEEVLQSLKGIVGRDSIYNALNALAPNGQPYFRQRSPSALPPASKEAAKQKRSLNNKKCFFVTEKKSGIKKRGPKQRYFKMPSIQKLCELLGVKVTASDPLQQEDLTSARQTRMAMYRELLKRRPAEYSRRWVAARIGVSRRTINTYNHLMPVHTQATFHETILSWGNIHSLLNDEILAGVHIETLSGKKYPALLSIACNLLSKGTFIRLKRRKGNLYWYGTEQPPPNLLPSLQQTIEPPRVKNAYPEPPPQPSPASEGGSKTRIEPSVGTEFFPSAAAVSPSPRPVSSVGNGLRPFPTPSSTNEEGNMTPIAPSVGTGFFPSAAPLSTKWRGVGGEDALSPQQQETLAQTIYERVNVHGDGTHKHFSLKNARKLVSIYSEKDIQFALQRLSQRKNLANPTGFFVTVLRSTVRMNELLR